MRKKIKKSENEFSSNDLYYRIPGFILLIVGLVFTYKILFQPSGACSADLVEIGSLYKGNTNKTIVSVLVGIGLVVNFYPIFMKVWKSVKGQKPNDNT